MGLRGWRVQVCEGTLLGNDWFRGVSGGQRKRVTTGVQRAGSEHPLS